MHYVLGLIVVSLQAHTQHLHLLLGRSEQHFEISSHISPFILKEGSLCCHFVEGMQAELFTLFCPVLRKASELLFTYISGYDCNLHCIWVGFFCTTHNIGINLSMCFVQMILSDLLKLLQPNWYHGASPCHCHELECRAKKCQGQCHSKDLNPMWMLSRQCLLNH